PPGVPPPASNVPHATTSRGVAQAIAFSRPSTAAAMGARSAMTSGVASASSAPRVPAYGNPTSSSSHFGGRLGSGFTGGGSGRTYGSYGSSYGNAGRYGGYTG